LPKIECAIGDFFINDCGGGYLSIAKASGEKEAHLSDAIHTPDEIQTPNGLHAAPQGPPGRKNPQEHEECCCLRRLSVEVAAKK
jgi:hypothetical protein